MHFCLPSQSNSTRSFSVCIQKLQRLVGIWKHSKEESNNPSGMGNIRGKNQWHNVQDLSAFLLPPQQVFNHRGSIWVTSMRNILRMQRELGSTQSPQGGLFSAF